MPIGLAGSTGHSTGSHLHFEIRFKGKNIDPAKVISFDNRCLISDTICLDGSYFQHYAYQKVKGGPTGYGGGYHGRYYTIRRGDTLGGISHKTGVPVKTLCRLNRLKPNSRLAIGRRIRLR
jgi:murein DD-endopeptidase MepM/ murein hydrolase activator NlpD